jgi:hypothetical protein
MAINDYQMCKKFQVLPTAPTLYQEKARTVHLFQIIDSVIAEEEEKENKKQKKKGGKK